MWPVYADALRIDLLERVDSKACSNGESAIDPCVGGEEVTMMGFDETTCDEYENSTYFVRFTFEGHGTIGPHGISHVVPVSLVKAVWE